MINIKKLITIALILIFVILIGLPACSAGEYGSSSKSAGPASASMSETNSTADDSSHELYKVDVFTMLGNYSGIQTGWFAKIVKDRFHMVLNVISSNVDGGADLKLSTMLAAGNLGDIVVFGSDDSKFLDSIKDGFLLDMNAGGLLGTYGRDILSRYPRVLEKSRLQYGNGTAVYGLGYNAADKSGGPSESEDMIWGPDLRWDLYEKLGCPAIKTMEDYLPVLEQMKKLEPLSESGKPSYGFSLWADWDTDKLCLAKQYANVFGYDETDGFNPQGFALISAYEDKYQDLLAPDSYYMRCIRLYFDANQRGLMDPDSISQKYEDILNKYREGQIFFSWFPWADSIYNTPERQEEGKGYRLVPFEEEKVYSAGANPYGGNRLIAIGSKAEHPERIMEFINWIYTPEGFQTYKYGPRGLAWDLKDGKPYLTEYGKNTVPSNGPVPVPEEYGGGTWKDGNCQMNIDPVLQTSVNPDTGEPYDFHLWTSYLNRTPTKLLESWRSSMGVLTAKEYFVTNNKIAVGDPVFTGKAPGVMDKTLEQKKGQIGTVIRQYSWRMVFAKNQAEFDSLRSEMTNKAKALGYDEILDWNIQQALKVFEARRTK